MSTAATVAVIGVGRIGLPLVTRLTRAGFTVVAHDVRPELSAAASESGAEWADSPEAAVAAAGVAITALPGTPELQQLMQPDTGGLLTRWPRGTVWIDLGSTAPDVAEQLSGSCRRRGVDYLAAPMGGGVDAMREGAVSLYIGGEAEVLGRVRPVIRAFAPDPAVHLLGDQRAACAAKLLINAVWFGHAVLYTEALLLARRMGLDPDRMRETLLGSAADSTFVRRHLPALLAGDYLADFGIDRCVEQLDAVQRLAEDAGLPHDVLGEVRRLHRTALAEFGAVPGELLAAASLENRAGTRLRTGGGEPRTADATRDQLNEAAGSG